MRIASFSFLHLLLICHLPPTVQSRAFPLNDILETRNGSHGDPFALSSQRLPGKRSVVKIPIHGLPHPLEGVFKNVRSFQPPLPIGIFIHFFLSAAQAFHNDIVPGRTFQRFKYGSLILECTAFSKVNDGGAVKMVEAMVTKEFGEAAALWLLDSAQKGWTEFFEAWVVDKAIADTVYYIHVANLWDSWESWINSHSLDFLDDFTGLGSPV